MHTTPAPAAPLTPGVVFENLQAYQRTAALKAAIELDIFRAIGEGKHDIASIARHASASERGTRILCDFLVINGLLQMSGDSYQHTPSSAAFLDPSSPNCLASIVGFLSHPDFCTYQYLRIVRKGRTGLREGELSSRKIPSGFSSRKAWAPHGPLGWSARQDRS